jgi:hypothetical protein
VRHSNTANHHQLQIASSYTQNHRLFFRKIQRGDTADAAVPWFEVLATKAGGALVASGSTTPGSTGWVQYSPDGIYVDVDTSAAGFSATPRYLSSLGGDSSHWTTMGGCCIYSPTATNFRVYIHQTGITVNQAQIWKWHINWIGVGS